LVRDGIFFPPAQGILQAPVGNDATRLQQVT
jgi:hypothetical protein